MLLPTSRCFHATAPAVALDIAPAAGAYGRRAFVLIPVVHAAPEPFVAMRAAPFDPLCFHFAPNIRPIIWGCHTPPERGS